MNILFWEYPIHPESPQDLTLINTEKAFWLTFVTANAWHWLVECAFISGKVFTENIQLLFGLCLSTVVCTFFSSHERGRMGAEEFCNILLICLTHIPSSSDYRKHHLIWEWKLRFDPFWKEMKALVLRNRIHWDMASPYVHKHRQDIYFLSLQPEICCLQPAFSFYAGPFASTDPSHLNERFGIFIKLISASIIWPCISIPWCADKTTVSMAEC